MFTLGSGLKITKVALPFHGTNYVLSLAKKWLGYVLGDFFTNSPGHPALAPNAEH
jgi:hypothetical protein